MHETLHEARLEQRLARGRSRPIVRSMRRSCAQWPGLTISDEHQGALASGRPVWSVRWLLYSSSLVGLVYLWPDLRRSYGEFLLKRQSRTDLSSCKKPAEGDQVSERDEK